MKHDFKIVFLKLKEIVVCELDFHDAQIQS